MSSGSSLSALDSAFLSLETPRTPMNVLGTLVLDASSEGGSDDSYAGLNRPVEARAHRPAPFRRRLAPMPLHLDHPVGVDDCDLDVASHVHRADPVDRLLALTRDAESSRELHTRLGFAALGEWAEFTSARLLGMAARLYAAWGLAGFHRPLHNLVISNVRGPEAPLFAAGARVLAAHPLGPPMEGAGLNITVFSYAGSVGFGVIACGRSVPHVEDIALGFSSAVGKLLKLAIAKEG